jgi:hypothetical protein
MKLHVARQGPGHLLQGNALASRHLGDPAADGRLDQDVVRAPDHHEVLHIVSPQQDQPTLTIDVVGVHDAQARPLAALRTVGEIQAPHPHPANDPKDDGGESDERDQPKP